MSSSQFWSATPLEVAEVSSAVTTVSELQEKQHATVLSPGSVSHLLLPGRSLYELSGSFVNTR